ncbi:hypothetical protein BURCENBC7_AP6122 [Burkholderia cenocepacia BC7]|nr:hypothetical protein BURCENBC7_AP6122 [Burkholderia cenocepacia BC7]
MLDFESPRRELLSQLSYLSITLKQQRSQSVDVVGQRGRG